MIKRIRTAYIISALYRSSMPSLCPAQIPKPDCLLTQVTVPTDRFRVTTTETRRAPWWRRAG